MHITNIPAKSAIKLIMLLFTNICRSIPDNKIDSPITTMPMLRPGLFLSPKRISIAIGTVKRKPLSPKSNSIPRDTDAWHDKTTNRPGMTRLRGLLAVMPLFEQPAKYPVTICPNSCKRITIIIVMTLIRIRYIAKRPGLCLAFALA